VCAHAHRACAPCSVDFAIVVDLLLDVHLAMWRAKTTDLVALLVILPACRKKIRQAASQAANQSLWQTGRQSSPGLLLIPLTLLGREASQLPPTPPKLVVREQIR
jgi:hypothetical protein